MFVFVDGPKKKKQQNLQCLAARLLLKITP